MLTRMFLEFLDSLFWQTVITTTITHTSNQSPDPDNDLKNISPKSSTIIRPHTVPGVQVIETKLEDNNESLFEKDTQYIDAVTLYVKDRGPCQLPKKVQDRPPIFLDDGKVNPNFYAGHEDYPFVLRIDHNSSNTFYVNGVRLSRNGGVNGIDRTKALELCRPNNLEKVDSNTTCMFAVDGITGILAKSKSRIYLTIKIQNRHIVLAQQNYGQAESLRGCISTGFAFAYSILLGLHYTEFDIRLIGESNLTFTLIDTLGKLDS